jgi:MFS transporter, FHS family, L-fucose permease
MSEEMMERATDSRVDTASALARPSILPFALIVALFFLWGMANNLNDILIAQFKKAFTLSDFRAGLVQSAFYLGYFLFAIPAGMFTRRFGFKGAVVLGLLLYACGAFLFWPAADRGPTGCFWLRSSCWPAAWRSWKPLPTPLPRFWAHLKPQLSV